MSDESVKPNVVKSRLKIKDLVRFGKKTGYTCEIDSPGFARRVCVENVGERGVCLLFDKHAGEAIITTQITISNESAEALCVMLGKMISEQANEHLAAAV